MSAPPANTRDATREPRNRSPSASPAYGETVQSSISASTP